MNEEQKTLLAIRAALTQLPQPQLDGVLQIASALRELLRRHGDSAEMALALVGAEIAEEEQPK